MEAIKKAGLISFGVAGIGAGIVAESAYHAKSVAYECFTGVFSVINKLSSSVSQVGCKIDSFQITGITDSGMLNLEVNGKNLLMHAPGTLAINGTQINASEISQQMIASSHGVTTLPIVTMTISGFAINLPPEFFPAVIGLLFSGIAAASLRDEIREAFGDIANGAKKMFIAQKRK
ncbi:MAG: hypothetical protein ACREBF_00040 [Candidatus Micrarchaeales archaeon]